MPALPEELLARWLRWSWAVGLGEVPPAVVPYLVHPWVVANDRLVATGWTQTTSNEEAYVAGHEASAIESISPRKRQELALGAAAGAIAATAAGIAVAVRRRRRRT